MEDIESNFKELKTHSSQVQLAITSFRIVDIPGIITHVTSLFEQHKVLWRMGRRLLGDQDKLISGLELPETFVPPLPSKFES